MAGDKRSQFTQLEITALLILWPYQISKNIKKIALSQKRVIVYNTVAVMEIKITKKHNASLSFETCVNRLDIKTKNVDHGPVKLIENQ